LWGLLSFVFEQPKRKLVMGSQIQRTDKGRGKRENKQEGGRPTDNIASIQKQDRWDVERRKKDDLKRRT
jgi:hypothetical protein